MADPNQDPRRGWEVMSNPSQGPGRRQDIADTSPTWDRSHPGPRSGSAVMSLLSADHGQCWS